MKTEKLIQSLDHRLAQVLDALNRCTAALESAGARAEPSLSPASLREEKVRLPFRLNIQQFACCLQCGEETARRHLRANRHGVVTKKLAMGAPWKISPAALALFGVDLALARDLLMAAGLMSVDRR